MEKSIGFSRKKVIHGSLLVGGTAIGAGMLALPIATAQAGFLPALVVYAVCWLFSLITGLLLLEISLVMPKNANLLSMSSKFLGPAGKLVAGLLYLFLFYSLTIGYVTGGGDVITSLFFPKGHAIWGILAFTLFFGGFVMVGHQAVHRINMALMGGLIITYCAFVGMGIGKVEMSNLEVVNFKYALPALPIIFTTFSYQGVVPSLVSYLGKDRNMSRLSIIIGSTLPFVIYVIWDFLFKGIIPLHGANGLLHAKEVGSIATQPLQHFMPGAPLALIGSIFAFFAMTTSFLGVTTGLVDFVRDGLSVKRGPWEKLLVAAIVFLPPMSIGMIDPSIFFIALNYAGGIGCVLLLGMIPTLMVWMKRYTGRGNKDLVGEVPGGRILFVILILFMIFEVGLTLG